MTERLLAQLQKLVDEATNEADRSLYRAQRAGAMARLGRIENARAEIQDLRVINAGYSPQLTGWILVAEGLVDHFESLSVNALDRFKRARGLAVALGDADLWSFTSAWMSASEFLTGDYETAARHAAEAIQKAPSTGSLALSRAHLVLANILYAMGTYEGAASQYTKARQFAVEAHDISMQSAVLYNVAAFHIARLSLEDAFNLPVGDEVSLAELELNSVANLDSGIGVDSLSAMVPILRAQLLLVKRDWEQADMFYRKALPDAVTYGPLRWESRFLAEQSHCHAMLGRRTSAADLASKAINQLTANIEVDDLAACHARVALSLAAMGDHVRAETHLNLGRECAAQFAARQLGQREKIGPLISPIQE